jgi:hypothetical protein
MHQPRRNWLRLDLSQLVSDLSGGYASGLISVAYEQKFRPAWSLLGEIQHSYALPLKPGLPNPQPQSEMTLSVGSRFFYHLPADLAEGVQADNLSANYLGLFVGSNFISPIFNTAQGALRDARWYSDNLSISLLTGIQRQLLHVAFFDLAFGVRVSYADEGYSRFIFRSYVEDGWQVFPVGHLRIGLGL